MGTSSSPIAVAERRRALRNDAVESQVGSVEPVVPVGLELLRPRYISGRALVAG